VDGGGIAEFGREVGQHGVEHLRLNGGGGVVIEIDALHGSVLTMILDPETARGENSWGGNQVRCKDTNG